MLVSQSRHRNHRSVNDARVTVTPQKSPVCMKYESLSVSKQPSIFHSVTRWHHATSFISTFTPCHIVIIQSLVFTFRQLRSVITQSFIFPVTRGHCCQVLHLAIINCFFCKQRPCASSFLHWPVQMFVLEKKRSSDCQFIYHHPPHPRNAQTLLVTITLGLEKIVLRNTPLQ